MTGIDRRTILRNCLASRVCLPASPAPWEAGRRRPGPQGATIRATHFGGPYGQLQEIIADPFAAAGLGEVVYEVDQPSLIMSKWQAAPNDPLYDVGLMVPIAALRAQQAGLVTALTAEDVPNLADAIPEALPPSGYGVHQMIDCIDLMYDKRQIPEPPTSWLDLWKPEYAGKIALPALPLNSMAALTTIAIARALGSDERDIDEAFEKMKELSANARLFFADPNQVTQLIERGDIAMAPQYGARIAQAMRRNDFVGRVTPAEGVPASPQTWSIAAGSPHQETAKAYIDFVLSQEVQQKMAETFLLAPVNRNVTLPDELAPLVMADYTKFFFADDEYVASREAEWSDR